MDKISVNYDLDIEVLTPLHIGSGVKLRRDFEFVTRGEGLNRVTYRLNDNAILDALWPEDEGQQRKLLSGSLADLIRDVRLDKHPEYMLYQYRGEPSLGEISEHIRDVYGQAYLPGSSLKGALRTAILRTMIEGVRQQPITRQQIGRTMRDEFDARAAKSADDFIEREYAGNDPNHDLFRALAISDTTPSPANALTLQKVQLVPGLDVDVEAIARSAKLRATARLDLHLLTAVRDQLGFDPKLANTMRSFAQAAQFTAEERIRRELRYHAVRDEDGAARFYANLLKQIEEKTLGTGKNAFFVQVGFAAGWRAKTVLGGLKDDDPLLEQVIHDFYLDRGGKASTKQRAEHHAGDPFPKARHLAYVGDKPALPMGWVKVTMHY